MLNAVWMIIGAALAAATVAQVEPDGPPAPSTAPESETFVEELLLTPLPGHFVHAQFQFTTQRTIADNCM
jgi:hypothetical protein